MDAEKLRLAVAKLPPPRSQDEADYLKERADDCFPDLLGFVELMKSTPSKVARKEIAYALARIIAYREHRMFLMGYGTAILDHHQERAVADMDTLRRHGVKLN